jgi:hypothetical protein
MGWQSALAAIGCYPFSLLGGRLDALETATAGLNAAELGVLNGVTPGTKANSKALVLDANGRINNVVPFAWEHNILADSDSRTGTAESVFSNGSWTIAANRLVAGSVIEFEAVVRCTGQNSTNTQRFKVRLGGVSGTVVADTTALDIASGGFAVLKGTITIRTAGASGTLVANSEAGNSVAGMGNAGLGSTAVDTTAALALAVTGLASDANAGNTARLQTFRARIAA